MTDVIMPQMGESIAEGTVTKWLKNVGDTVQRDEPLFEISTDKVDAEIPAPASGVLQEIRVQPGATVAINTVVGVIAARVKPAGRGSGRERRPRLPRPPRPSPAPHRPPPVAAAPRRLPPRARTQPPAPLRARPCAGPASEGRAPR
jgi:2-oxoglutarate dehydrogenase E2 component (dihydrolipoamide succinyltransferase)